MQKTIAFKILVIGVLVLVLLIPIMMIRGVISERTRYREEAYSSIANSWTGPQNLSGPLLVIPFDQKEITRVKDPGSSEYRLLENIVRRHLFILPDNLHIRSQVQTETRKRGIYQVPVYNSRIDLEGEFSNADLLTLVRSNGADLKIEQARLLLGVSDIRGAVQQPSLSWNDASHTFEAGSVYPDMEGGMSAGVGRIVEDTEKTYRFQVVFELRGMESLSFNPTGNNSVVEMEASWPHPSFTGRYLPAEHDITTEGFSAVWKTSAFSSSMSQVVEALEGGSAHGLVESSFGVSMINPVDIYQQSERSVKYGVLFIALTFVAFFTFEVVKRLRLHPVQYLLVGAALTVFYLLLLSLSEHLPFTVAYLIAAVACCGLVGIYTGAALKSTGHGVGFCAYLVLLYGMLYAILQSEDNALLMGSTLLFAVLALVMYVTRKIDWYGLTDQLARSDGDPVL